MTTAVARVGADRRIELLSNNAGAWLGELARSGMAGVDSRLHRLAAASGMHEGVGSEGGFLAPAAVTEQLLAPVFAEDPIASRVTRIDVAPGVSTVKATAYDEVSRADAQRLGGVQMLFLGEADPATASKPKLRQLLLSLKKLIGLAWLTSEMTEDSPNAEARIVEAFQAELAHMLGAAIFAGSGQGKPLGVLTSNAAITVTKEAAQVAATFVALNAAKMFARMAMTTDPSGVVWLVNQDAFPQLLAMTLASGTSVGPLYIPAVAGDVAAPYGRLIGRPVVPCEHSSTLGTKGDVALVDLAEYAIADHPAKLASSLHVRFLHDEQALRISYRVDGQPIWSSPVTPKNGTATVSPIILLETRA